MFYTSKIKTYLQNSPSKHSNSNIYTHLHTFIRTHTHTRVAYLGTAAADLCNLSPLTTPLSDAHLHACT